MLAELALRFALGGLTVSAFATLAETLKPKTFSGIFGAGPSVAIASFALAFHERGAHYVTSEARAMVAGALALAIYASLCVFSAKRRQLPVWLGAGIGWVAWIAAAGAIWAAWTYFKGS
jgi:Protein of unknown function (DUF3147)